MKVAMFNLKGGQGKSSIALNLALTMNANIISNDLITQLEDVMPEDNFLNVGKYDNFPDITEELDIIYDLGGWVDSRILKVIKNVNLVIVPMINSNMSNKTSLNSLNQIKNYNKNILIIANKTKKNDFEIISELVNNHFPENNFPILELKETTAFERILQNKQSIEKITENDKLLKFCYNKILEQFRKIIEYVKNTDLSK
jgi:MinD superfamily P-loop ATPase